MPTQWTDFPATSTTPIRALHMQELREAVDCNRAAYGLPPFAWNDDPVTTTTPIRYVHFVEARVAIQDLWVRKGMGTIPNWTSGATPAASTPIHASDINDLRAWLNSYETNTTGAVYSPLRGLHLRNGADMRDEDVRAARMFDPRMVAVLHIDAVQPTTLAYLKSLPQPPAPNGVEIFCRRWPTTIPTEDYVTFEGYSDWLRDSQGNFVYKQGLAEILNPPALALHIRDQYRFFRDTLGITITRWYPGNEPEIEWFDEDLGLIGQYGYTAHHWDDLNAYYRDVYFELKELPDGDQIELYPPAFAGFASVGIGSYRPEGNVNELLLDDGSKGFDHVRPMIEFYQNNSPGVGRVNWHNYFWPGRQDQQQSVFEHMPQWLKDYITLDGYPARVTEFGWTPDCFKPPCNANLDDTVGTCAPPPESLTSWGDYSDFIRHRVGAGGAAVWLLSAVQASLQSFAAVDAATPPSIRKWFKRYACMLNANL